MSLNSLLNVTKDRVADIVSRALDSTLVKKISTVIGQLLSQLSVNVPEQLVTLISLISVLVVGQLVAAKLIKVVKVAASKLGLSVGADVSDLSDSSNSSSSSSKCGKGRCGKGRCGKGDCSSSSTVVKHNCLASSSDNSSSGAHCANGCGVAKCANGCGNVKCANGCGSSSS